MKLTTRNGGNIVKVRIKSLGIIILLAIVTGYFISGYFGFWKTEKDRSPRRLQTEEVVTETRGNEIIAEETEYDPADIRGSHTLSEIEEFYNVPMETIAQAFDIGVERDLKNFKVKELESVYEDLSEEIEIGTGSVRYFVAKYNGLDYESDEDVYLLRSGYEILEQKGSFNEEEIKYFKTHIVDLEK